MNVWMYKTFKSKFLCWAFETTSSYLQCEVEPLLAVPLIVQALLEPQGAPLLLFVTHHVELLLLVSSYNTKGQLGIFSCVPVLCCKLQNLRKSNG